MDVSAANVNTHTRQSLYQHGEIVQWGYPCNVILVAWCYVQNTISSYDTAYSCAMQLQYFWGNMHRVPFCDLIPVKQTTTKAFLYLSRYIVSSPDQNSDDQKTVTLKWWVVWTQILEWCQKHQYLVYPWFIDDISKFIFRLIMIRADFIFINRLYISFTNFKRWQRDILHWKKVSYGNVLAQLYKYISNTHLKRQTYFTEKSVLWKRFSTIV